MVVDFLEPSVKDISETWDRKKKAPEKPIGSLQNCLAYTPSVDIDSIKGSNDGIDYITRNQGRSRSCRSVLLTISESMEEPRASIACTLAVGYMSTFIMPYSR